jgi:hypothetical protein
LLFARKALLLSLIAPCLRTKFDTGFENGHNPTGS